MQYSRSTSGRAFSASSFLKISRCRSQALLWTTLLWMMPLWGTLTLVPSEVLAQDKSATTGSGQLASKKAVEGLEKAMPGYAIARCMFPQGRLVLEKGEELLVLRQGDQLPGPNGMRVLEISETRAVLARAAVGVHVKTSIHGSDDHSPGSASLVPEQLVFIEVGPDGATTVTVGSAQAVFEHIPALDESEGLISLTPDGSESIVRGDLRSQAPPAAPVYKDPDADAGEELGGGRR